MSKLVVKVVCLYWIFKQEAKLFRNNSYGVLSLFCESTNLIRPSHNRYHLYNNKCPKWIWQKATSPTCHPSRLKIYSSYLAPYLIHGSIDPQKSVCPNGISIGSANFAQHIRVTNTHTDTQSTLRATSVAIGRILYTVCRQGGLIMLIYSSLFAINGSTEKKKATCSYNYNCTILLRSSSNLVVIRFKN